MELADWLTIAVIACLLLSAGVTAILDRRAQGRAVSASVAACFQRAAARGYGASWACYTRDAEL